MTYLYYKTSSTGNIKPNEKTIDQWKHLSEKKNWRITQLPNGFYQTECLNPDNEKEWHDVTRRETVGGAESPAKQNGPAIVALPGKRRPKKTFKAGNPKGMMI